MNGWKDDYYTLKHYRYIRNQIAHDAYADEENMCSKEDEEWLESFHRRIMTQTDPLALYQKTLSPQKHESSQRQKPQAAQTHYTSSQPPNLNKRFHSFGLAVFMILAVILFAIIAIYFIVK